MSAEPAQFMLPFSHYAKLGYLPIPIVAGQKRPLENLTDWNNPTRVWDYTALDAAGHSVGLLCENIVGLDIDLTDAEHVEKIEALIRKTLKLPKATPRRVGRAPKALLIMRVADPLPGFDLRHAKKTVLFQLLGAGKQFVVQGIHPDTGQPYTLNRPLPAHSKLPLLTPAGYVALREALTEGLTSLGYEVGVASAVGGPARGAWSGPAWSALGLTQAEDALAALDPDMDRLSWVNVGMALADGTHGSEEGFALWDEWSTASPKYNGREMRKQWKSFKPGGITRASLFKNNWLKREPVVSEADDYAPYVDWLALAKNPPQPKRMIVKNWLYEGTVALFAGHGGVGKSFMGLQFAIQLALGREVLGHASVPERVTYYSCEDDADTIYWRSMRICASLGAKIEDLDGWLLVRDFTQSNAIMYSDAQGAPNTDHQAMKLFGADVENFEATVAFIDNASDVFNGNEIARAQVRAFVRGLQAKAKRCAVVLLAHVDKLSAKNPETSQGYSGSTAWNNSVRSRWYLYPQSLDGGLVLELQKSNYGKVGEQFSVRYDEPRGVFAVAPVEAAKQVLDAKVLVAMLTASEKGVSLPASKYAPRNVFNYLVGCGALPKGTKQEVCANLLARLAQLTFVEVSAEVGANRKTREVWRLTEHGKTQAFNARGALR